MKVQEENGAFRTKHKIHNLDSYLALVNGDLLINCANGADAKQNWVSLPGLPEGLRLLRGNVYKGSFLFLRRENRIGP